MNAQPKEEKPGMDLSSMAMTQQDLDERRYKEMFKQKLGELQGQLDKLADELPNTVKLQTDREDDDRAAFHTYVECTFLILTIRSITNSSARRDEGSPREEYAIEVLEHMETTMHEIGRLYSVDDFMGAADYSALLIRDFIHLGHLLGFPLGEVEQAYYDETALRIY